MMKMKFSAKIKLLKIQRIGHLIANKYGGQKRTSQINPNAPPMSPLFYTSAPGLTLTIRSCNNIINLKKKHEPFKNLSNTWMKT